MTTKEIFKYLSGKEALVSSFAGLYPGIHPESYVRMKFNGTHLELFLGKHAKETIMDELAGPLSNKIRENLSLNYDQRDFIHQIICENLDLDFPVATIFTHNVYELDIEYKNDGIPYALEMENSSHQIIRIHNIQNPEE